MVVNLSLLENLTTQGELGFVDQGGTQVAVYLEDCLSSFEARSEG